MEDNRKFLLLTVSCFPVDMIQMRQSLMMMMMLSRSLWEDLEDCDTNISLVFGEKDVKFKQIAIRMYREMSKSKKIENNIIEMVEIPKAGHAVHLESPLRLTLALGKFLTRVRKRSAETELSKKLLLAVKET